ncbi:polyamine aminopropyltransferase [Sebaldella sp. S0638]|uniref:polyamine aminopropyltransferase n=1 Tax=Sebaldella sp. S0638 TaxID=2957809 RepID=UPI00209F8BA0|nr:polyamine aminopropyltransferase [Sebaldella sp. S0638]MCP1224143.1 polyamine aminopropyltransferase [Sebaldella sp. S0638]
MEFWYSESYSDNVKLSIKVDKQLHGEQSDFQRIDFFESKEFGRFFTLDGLMMATEKDEFIYHDMITHTALAVNPGIRNVLVIGAGDGGTVRELTRYKNIEKIHMVEIDERVVRLCEEYLPLTASKLKDSRVSLYFQDGLEFVKKSQEKYDLIIVDSTDPIGPGEGLFTMDFYTDCYNLLSDEGILINQHESPYYDKDRKELIRTRQKIKKIFEISRVYQAHIPTYPSGHWLFGFASKKYDPVKDIKADEWNNMGLETKYYNTDLHVGSFALPTYVNELMEEEL